MYEYISVIFLALVVTLGVCQEPGNWPSCQKGAERSSVRTNTTDRVTRLREQMLKNRLEAYIVPAADFHLSEFVSSYDERRRYISGFSGSAGTAVITNYKLALWTDGRYFLQAETELGCDWILMREGEEGVPGIVEWISEELTANQRVGACPLFFSSDSWEDYTKQFSGLGVIFQAVLPDLIDMIWKEERVFPSTPINALPLKYAGKSWQEKLLDVFQDMDKHKADVLILTGLDETAWQFNARATDISGFVDDPFFYSYSIIVKDKNPRLYIVDPIIKLTQDPTDPATNITLAEHLNTGTDGSCTSRSQPCVEVLEYNYITFMEDIDREVKKPGVKRVWLSYHCNYAIYATIPKDKVYVSNTPTTMMKTRKNDVEVAGMTNSHVRDGAAVARFMSKLEKTLKAGEKWTELSAATDLSRFRRLQKDNRGDSFSAISSIGPNAAINHYFVTPETDRPITLNETYLLDSGGQYLDGTTDITRTFYFSEPDAFLKECYTRVLMGHIDLAQAIWDKGRYGREIDAFARKALWDVGLVFRHGTGHGIGAYLSVHEGPGRISNHHPLFVWDVPLEEHMFFSDEPGYYQTGEFGIRLENIIYVKKVETKYNFPGSTMLGFETITLVPYEPHLIDFDLLTDKQISWLNDYNKQVRDKVGPLLKEQADLDAYQWVMRRTARIDRVTSDARTWNLSGALMIVWLNVYNKQVRDKIGPLLKEQADLDAYQWVMRRTARIDRVTSDARTWNLSGALIVFVLLLWCLR